MRISTNMLFTAGVSGMNQQSAAALKLTEQISLSKRIVTPADDPVAAAQALQVQQAQDINSQFAANIGSAQSVLSLEDTQMSTITDLFGRFKELTVEASASGISASSRNAIAVELRGRFDQLVGIANATDGTGQYLFSGYKGSTQPFAGSVDGLLANPASDITYQGDDGQRTLAISPSHQLAITDSGADVFMRIPTGNGYFTTSYAGTNAGTGVVSTGTVTDSAVWNSANKPLTVHFSVAAGTTTYDVVDGLGTTLSTGNAYTANQPLTLPGINVTVSGSPANGDSFVIQSSSTQSMFRSLADLIGALENPATGAAANAKYQVDVASASANLDQAGTNIQRVISAIGARMNEATSQDTLNGDLKLQYAQTLSSLQDLDYTQALTDLTRTQTILQAAQKSFAAVSNLSLFNYI